jgi:16S rRNA (adenine1518-N6/adenine1519-N6)-dimethyltransferase
MFAETPAERRPNLTAPSEVRALLARHGLHPKKRLGQHFLIDGNLRDRIVQAAGVHADESVLEIGPGLGTLTQALASTAKHVVAVEVDPAMVAVLGETVAHLPNVAIVAGDFLKLPWLEWARETFGAGPVAVVANVPYYITTPILTTILEAPGPVVRLVVMVQREVADRLMAAPGSDAYGSLSVLARLRAEVTMPLKVSRHVFLPPPEVDSAVVRLDLRPHPEVRAEEEPAFFRVSRAAFEQRRKTLLNALTGAGGFPREEAHAALEATGLSPTLRGETLDVPDFARLARALQSMGAGAE